MTTVESTTSPDITTHGPVAERGARIAVAYDPTNRVDPRPVASIGDPGLSLAGGIILFGIGLLCLF
ncbi:MAG TPA: hypothetical protein VFA63_18195 [Pseudonocardiaceae bacterium]|jgi:hypothetical protein|nr:hypothetical protein [Pseudonocardiaceae bacterium]